MPAASAVSSQSLTLDDAIIPATDLMFGVNDESFAPTTDRNLVIVGDRNTCAPDVAQHLVSEALTQHYRTIIIPHPDSDGRFDFASTAEILHLGGSELQDELTELVTQAHAGTRLSIPVLLVVEDLHQLDSAPDSSETLAALNTLLELGPEAAIHLVVNAGEMLNQPYRLALANTALGRNINHGSVVIAGTVRDDSEPELWWGSRVLTAVASTNPNDAVMVTQKPGSLQLQVPDFD